MKITAQNIEQALTTVFQSEEWDLALVEATTEDAPAVGTVETFEDAGVLTRDRGLMVSLTDGTQVYLTIQLQ